MHQMKPEIEALSESILAYAMDRMRMDPPTIDHPLPQTELEELVGQTITEKGLGGEKALELFVDTLAPACISEDHPRYLAFVPTAPSEVSALFDLVVGASNICASSWLEGAGAIYAENQALRWIADIAGLPPEAGGVFVSGGTAGNLSALVAARHDWRQKSPDHQHQRGLIISSRGAHASVDQAAQVMDADIVQSGGHRLTGADVAATIAALSEEDRLRLFAVACTAGTTNLGIIDDLEGIGDVCADEDIWFHVDGAYG
ncbi:aminotransferase class V-fold PLP-dependent enzyme, partial [Luminiphilus sp.]